VVGAPVLVAVLVDVAPPVVSLGAPVDVDGVVVGVVLVEVSPPQAVKEATSARLAAVRARF
jgi:hypothetical protein